MADGLLRRPSVDARAETKGWVYPPRPLQGWRILLRHLPAVLPLGQAGVQGAGLAADALFENRALADARAAPAAATVAPAALWVAHWTA